MQRSEDASLDTVTRLNQRDPHKNTPVILAVYRAGNSRRREDTEKALALINNPAVDLSLKNRDGNTVLDIAKTLGKRFIIEAIEERLKRESSARMSGYLYYPLFGHCSFFTPTADNIPSANFDQKTSNNLDF